MRYCRFLLGPGICGSGRVLLPASCVKSVINACYPLKSRTNVFLGTLCFFLQLKRDWFIISLVPICRSILKGFLSKDFFTAVAGLSDGLVSATLEVYGKVAREMLPTPSRPHYTFNLRDISKVIQASDLHLHTAYVGQHATKSTPCDEIQSRLPPGNNRRETKETHNTKRRLCEGLVQMF